MRQKKKEKKKNKKKEDKKDNTAKLRSQQKGNKRKIIDIPQEINTDNENKIVNEIRDENQKKGNKDDKQRGKCGCYII